MSQTCQYRVSAKALVKDAYGKLLFVEENEGNGFELPGGGIENGETAWHALERELAEELNAKLLSMSDCPTYAWIINGEVIWLLFKATIDTIDNFSASEYAAEAAYYYPTELLNRTEHGLGYCTKTNYEDLLSFVSS